MGCRLYRVVGMLKEAEDVGKVVMSGEHERHCGRAHVGVSSRYVISVIGGAQVCNYGVLHDIGIQYSACSTVPYSSVQ